MLSVENEKNCIKMGFISNLFGTDGAYKSAEDDLNKAKNLEMSYYKAQASMDPLQTSEAQASLKAARDMLAENTKRLAATNAVAGGSDYAVALQKKNATDAVGNMMSQMSAGATARKDDLMRNYLGANKEYTNAINNIRIQQAQAETQALSGLLNAGIGAASKFIKPI